MSQEIRNIIKNKLNEDEIEGGYADDMSVSDIANKHGVNVDYIEDQLKKGIEIEYEHVNDRDKSKEIALDHLYEIPDYYDKLIKMEKENENNDNEGNDMDIHDMIKNGYFFSKKLSIQRKGNEIGYVVIGRTNEDIDDVGVEILDLKIDDNKFNPRKIIGDMLIKIWELFPNVHKIFLTPTEDSRPFWNKMGAQRLNDSYFIIYRGH